jgi:hypothetical protein
MNEELLAASVLFVQSGVLMVGYYGFLNIFALGQYKPTQVCSAPAVRPPSFFQQHWRHLNGNHHHHQ